MNFLLGASDDGLNCAVMLEVLRVLSKQDTPLQQNIIFLFNGAEETPLQVSPVVTLITLLHCSYILNIATVELCAQLSFTSVLTRVVC